MKPFNELKIAITNDHAGYELKKTIVAYLEKKSVKKLTDFGCQSTESCDYPDFAHPMGKALEQGEYDYGISICGSGNGISMVMNKYPSVRAALCWNDEIVKLARLHNDANVLSLPGRFLSDDEALRIVELFFTTDFEGERHIKRINKIPIH